MESEIQYKKCTCCGGEFPATAEYWAKHKPGKFGFSSICKRCVSKKHFVRYHSDDSFRDKVLCAGKTWHKNNKDYMIRWRKDNPEYCKKNNAEKIEKLTPGYIAASMRRSVNDLTPEIIETKRLIIQLKRELKNNNVKIR